MRRPPAVCTTMNNHPAIAPGGERPGRPVTAVCRGRALVFAALVLAAVALIGLPGCATSSPERYDVEETGDASTTFSGDRYLRGTIGSYGAFVNNRPLYVGGYGMVVDLNATGSNEVPGFLRDYLVNEMLRNKLGSVQFGTQRFSPERVMADLGSSVVAVEGLIPPGARRGSKFDLLVSMIDQTSTSLAGGRLFWPTQLSPTGLDRRLIYTHTQAAGYGELFVNPIVPEGEDPAEFLRQAVVVNGGTVLESQSVRYVLNQPSYRVSNLVADRINARFEAADSDNLPTAVAKSDAWVQINVPERFNGQPRLLLALIEHLYLDPSPGFVRPQAQALADALTDAPEDRARSVSLAWKGLGPNALPVIRKLYNHPQAQVRKAALDAGAWLSDNQAVPPLTTFIKQGDAADRVFAADTLVTIPRNETARKLVRALLNDPDPEVRLGAYQALVKVGDRAIKRISVHDGTKHKFYIDRVPSQRPMVYALQDKQQAIVIFGDDIPLHRNVFAKIDDTLTVRTLPVSSIPAGLSDRYEGDTAFVPIHRCGPVQLIPSLAPASNAKPSDEPVKDWRVEIGDRDGNTMLVNVRDPELQDTLGVELLNKPNRGQATPQPRLIATVRIVRQAGRDAAGTDGQAVGELLALKPADARLPVAIRYLPPGEREPKVYRISPTVGTFAYTLGFKRDDVNAQFGPDLSFSQVVRALHRLSEQDQIPAPFYARISPLAQRIAAAQREGQAESRPEITPEELELLRRRDANTPDPNQPDPPADTQPDTQAPPAEGEESTPPDASVGRGPEK